MLKEKMRWIFFSDMLEDEYRQCMDEGRSVEQYLPQIERILRIEEEEERNSQAEKLLAKMEQSPVKEGFPYFEPTDYAGIAATLPEEAKKRYEVAEGRLEESIKGGWYGRLAGCVLGIPVEGWTRRKIESYLKETGQLPLASYISRAKDKALAEKYGAAEKDMTTPYDRQKMCWIDCLEGRFPVDDDINYTTVALKVLERFGRSFTPEDVAETWLLSIPPLHACTAERAAIRNLLTGALPPESAVRCNPYREWIGAQIRGDFFGYINPGDPCEAARMAYGDAAVSHMKNGVYGEMFIAALISLCFVKDMSMEERVERALLQIPPKSRLHEGLEKICTFYRKGQDYEEAIGQIHDWYNEEDPFDWCLTIPNAMIVTACLLWKRDMDEAITAAVRAGFDTDCNGATVGSAWGILGGFEHIEPKWYEGFEAVIHTSVHGYHDLSLDEAVQRTAALAKQ